MLYQLSYLGVLRDSQGADEPAGYSGLTPSCPYAAVGQNAAKSRLFAVLAFVVAARHDIPAGEPAVEIDVTAAGRAERARGFAGRLAADRAGPCFLPAFRRLRGLRRH